MTPVQTNKAKILADAGRIARPNDIPTEYYHIVLTEPRPGDNFMPGYQKILCPVIGARKDRTKLLVIAPDGTDQWVAWK